MDELQLSDHRGLERERVGIVYSKAAIQLRVERTNLHKKMRTYGIRREDRDAS